MSCNYKQIRKIRVNEIDYTYRFTTSGSVKIFKNRKQIYHGSIMMPIPSYVKALICRIEKKALNKDDFVFK
jgi:hypothetical protein